MKKRILFVLVAAIVAITSVSLVGCGSSGDNGKDDWQYIKDNGKLIVGLDDTFAPMGFRDDDNNIVGFDIDLAKAVGKELGVDVEFKAIEWKAKEQELKSKKIDCIWNGMSVNKDREKEMTLSKEYLLNKIVLVSMKKNINVKSAADLKNVKIGTQAESSALEKMESNKEYKNFKDNIKEYDTYDDAIMDMKAGRVDVVAIDDVLAEYKKKNMDDPLYFCTYDLGADYYAIGFRKGDTELANKVNKAIKATIDSGEAKKISDKWFGKDIVVYRSYK
ncbi:MAG: amino acid ABC transporter substrate-binding protein [Anaerovoracaceae bacterium]